MSTATTDPDLRQRWETDRKLYELAVAALRELEWIKPLAQIALIAKQEQLYTDAGDWDARELTGYGQRIAAAVYRDARAFLTAADEAENQCHFGLSFPGDAIYEAQDHALRAMGLTLAALCCPGVDGPLREALGVSASHPVMPLRDTLSEAMRQAQEAVRCLDGILEGIADMEKEMTAAP